MPELVGMIQTTWPKIRVALYKREDGLFQFIEEGFRSVETGKEVRIPYHKSELFHDIDASKAAMVEYYCHRAEDEYVVDPASVTILEPPDFKGPYHPKLTVRRP